MEEVEEDEELMIFLRDLVAVMAVVVEEEGHMMYFS